jgi:hypothetical protein
MFLSLRVSVAASYLYCAVLVTMTAGSVMTMRVQENLSTKVTASAIAWRPIILEGQSPTFGKWLGPSRPSLVLAHSSARKAEFLTSANSAAHAEVSLSAARQLGVTVDDIFQDRSWFTGITRSAALSIGVNWRTLRDLGMTKTHVVQSRLPVRVWTDVLGAGPDFQRTYGITISSGQLSKQTPETRNLSKIDLML